jgi:deoxyxylulose-5-phosphate synthase
MGGLGGFPRREESDHDVFDGGHAGTGLSIAQAWPRLATCATPWSGSPWWSGTRR